MMNYIVTAFFITGLFLNPKRPALSFFIWSGTSLYWLIWNFRCEDFPQAVMFAASTVACVIQFWRTA
jgi:hypothetical protein